MGLEMVAQLPNVHRNHLGTQLAVEASGGNGKYVGKGHVGVVLCVVLCVFCVLSLFFLVSVLVVRGRK